MHHPGQLAYGLAAYVGLQQTQRGKDGGRLCRRMETDTLTEAVDTLASTADTLTSMADTLPQAVRHFEYGQPPPHLSKLISVN